MNVRRCVAAFLILHEGTDFCDDCLAGTLGISAAQMRSIVPGVAKSSAFLRDQWTCRTCRRQTVVTRAVPNATFALSRRSRGRGSRIA